jgi:hypothetical protein
MIARHVAQIQTHCAPPCGTPIPQAKRATKKTPSVVGLLQQQLGVFVPLRSAGSPVAASRVRRLFQPTTQSP